MSRAAGRIPQPVFPAAGGRPPRKLFCSCWCGGWMRSHDALTLRFTYKEWSQLVTFPWTLPLTKEETEAWGGGRLSRGVPELARRDSKASPQSFPGRPVPPLGGRPRSPRAARRAGSVGAGPGRTSVLCPPSTGAVNTTLRGRAGGRATREAGAHWCQAGSAWPAASLHLHRPRLACDGLV